MTRKDFEMIAAALRDAQDGYDKLGDDDRDRAGYWAVKTAANYIADGCKADNPNFDRKRFLNACGFDA